MHAQKVSIRHLHHSSLPGTVRYLVLLALLVCLLIGVSACWTSSSSSQGGGQGNPVAPAPHSSSSNAQGNPPAPEPLPPPSSSTTGNPPVPEPLPTTVPPTSPTDSS